MVMTCLECINEAKLLITPTADGLNLVRQYDWTLKEITSRYKLIRNQQKTGTLVASQNYVILPPNFAFPELLKINGYEIDYIEPEDWRKEYDEDDSAATPSIWTVIKSDKKFYMHVPPSTAWDYILYYVATHPKAGRARAFTSGGTYEIKPGVTVTGATGGATAIVSFVDLTSGTWAAGTAAGTLIFSSQSGTFQTENLNVGSDLNVATIAGDSSIETEFLHLLDEEWEEDIVLGIAARACLKTVPVQMERYFALTALFKDAMELQGGRDIRLTRSRYVGF